MRQDLASYTLSSLGTMSSCSRTLALGGQRHLIIVAEASLEGWGVVSEDFSREFLGTLLGYVPQHLNEDVLADVAQPAFEESIARFVPDYPPWSSAQYVASYVQGRELYFSWIGDMYLVAWSRSKTQLLNQPHVAGEGEVNRTILRGLRLKASTTQQTMPEVGKPLPLESPTILFLGNKNPCVLVPEFTCFQQLLNGAGSEGFQEQCRELGEALVSLGVRGMFVYI